jgi:hypothetical protein
MRWQLFKPLRSVDGSDQSVGTPCTVKTTAEAGSYW